MPLFDLPAPLVLASTSRYRQAQLARLGVPFAAVRPDYDESAVAGLSARALVQHHARQKALCVHASPEHTDSFILGADQVVILPGRGGEELLGKPGSVEAAVAQLMRLAGQTHELVTAVCLVLPDGRLLERTVAYEMRVRPLAAAEALAYVVQDQPLDCAGSYKIEAAGPWLLEHARGDDPTAIEGLPLMAVCALLREALAISAA